MGNIENNPKSLIIKYKAINMYEFRLMYDRMKKANEIIEGCENNLKFKSTTLNLKLKEKLL